MTIDAQEILEGKPQTIGALLAWRIEQTPHAQAYKFRDRDDQWASIDWTETGRLAERIGAGLLDLGLGLEDRVAIVSSTRVEWVLADLGINVAGGATTTIYPNTQGEDFDHIITDSGSRFLFAEDAEQLAKLRAHPASDAQIEAVILMDGDGDGDHVLSWDELGERGDRALANDPGMVKRATDATTGDGLATLIYTSGTTGRPKGAELTHRGWAYEGFAVDRVHILGPDDLQYLWLPLSHVFGKAIASCQLAIGFQQLVDGRIDRIVENLGEAKPQIMCGVPRIFEKVRATVFLSARRNGIQGRIARWAFAVGRDSRPYRLAGQPMPARLRASYALADRLVFSRLRATMGDNIKVLISGSAKLNAQVQAWFYSAGILIIEGYGMTETSAITFLTPKESPKFGSVGPALPGTQVRIADDGEVLIKGPGVMRGYHNNPAGTAEALTDGWYHTGDIGELDENGYLSIIDRKRDVMKTSGGKYVSPAKVESVIAAEVPYVSQVVAVGDGRKYVSALLTMDADNVLKWAALRGIEGQDYAQILQNPDFQTTVAHGIKRANEKLERWETVKRFEILPSEFDVDSGVVTPSQKIRRAMIAKRYAGVVDSLYDDEPVEDE